MRNEVNRALVAKKNKFQSKAVPRGTRTIWRYLSAFILFFSLSIGQMWATASTTTDGKYATGTIDFSTIGTLSGTTTYWHNGVKFYSGNATSISANNTAWSTSVSIPAYVSNVTAGKDANKCKWGNGGTAKQYTQSGFACSQHTIGIHVNQACTLTIVVNKNVGSDTDDADISASIDDVAYGTAYTSSTYKAAGSTALTVTSARADKTNASGRYTLTIVVGSGDLKNGEAVVKMFNGSSGSGAGKLFCWESITVTPASATNYAVTIDPNGGSYASTPDGWTYSAGVYTKSIASGTSFSAPAGLSKGTDGLTWKDGSNNDVTFPVSITGNITFVAQWTPVSAAPTISAHPSTTDVQYIKDAAATALSVTASGSGTVTYQWYSNTTASNTDGTVLTNCTTSTYTPSTATEGKLYYYCEVTNTETSKSPKTIKSNVSGLVRVVAAPTHLIENVMATSGTWDSYIVSANAHISNLKTITASEGKTLIKSGKEEASSSRTPGITSNSSSTLVDGDYIYLQFTIEDGYELTVSDASVQVFSISNPGKYVARISDNAATPNVIATDETSVAKSADKDLFDGYDFSSSPTLTGTVTLKLFAYGWSDGYRMKSPIYIDGEVKAVGACTTPTIAWDGDQPADAYVSDGTKTFKVTSNYTDGINLELSSNTCGATIAAKSGSDNKQWVVSFTGAGSVTITPKVAGDGTTYCAGPVSAAAKTLTVTLAHDVTFNMNDHGVDIAKQVVADGGKATAPYVADVADWVFGGWYTDAECTEGNEFDFANTTISAATPLYAKWTADACAGDRQSLSKVVLTNASAGTVTGYNGNEYAGTAVIAGLSDTQTADLGSGTVTGYKMNNGGSAIVFATLKKGSFQAGDKVVIGITKKNDAYKIDSKGQPVLRVYYGTDASDATLLTTIEGATAPGYYTYRLTEADVTAIGSKKGIGLFRESSNGQNPYVYSVEITGCRSFAVSHDVTFDMKSHGTQVTKQTIEVGAKVTEPAEQEVAGYIFGGWYKETTLVNKWNFSTDVMPDNDITLYAKWTEDPCTDRQSLSKVVLTAKDNGTVTGYNSKEYAGEAIIESLDSYEDADIIGDATKERGYKLNSGGKSIVMATLKKGTFQEGDKVIVGITKVNDQRTVDASTEIMTIYAGSDKDHMMEVATIKNVNAAGFYTYRLTAANATAINEAGYKSIGLFRASSNGQNHYVYSVEITGCREWTVSHEVTFDMMEHGTQVDPQTVPEGDLLTKPTVVEPEGWAFAGWYKENTFENEWDFTTDVMGTSDMTLYAKWEDETSAIKLLNGATVNHTNFITAVTADETVEFKGNVVNYAKFSGTVSGVNGVKDLTRVIAYNATTNKTKIQISAHNNSTSGRNILVKGLVEGAAEAVDLATIALGNKEDKVSDWIEFNNAANRTIYIMVSSSAGDVYFTQVKVIESGETPMKQAGEAGYSLNLNKGRFFGTASIDLAFEGLNARLSGDYTALNSGYAKLTSTSMSFTVATPMLLKVTTNNNKTYYVTKGAAGTDNETAKTGVSEFDLTAGTWYITAGDAEVQFTNIAFIAPKCEEPTITPMSNSDLCEGDDFAPLTVSASVSDGGTLHYQWYKHPAAGDDEAVGTDAASYTPEADGQYYVVVTNKLADHSDNSKASNTVTVEHFAAAVITTAPLNQRGEVGDVVTLSAAATGKNVAYKWYTCDEDGSNEVALDPAQTGTSIDVTITAGLLQWYKVKVTSDCGGAEAKAKVSEFVPTTPANVTTSILWDWTSSAWPASGEVQFTNKTEDGTDLTPAYELLADADAIVPNNAAFRSDMLYGKGQWVWRSGNKFFQGTAIKFNTTVAGKVRVNYRSTGNNKEVQVTIAGTPAGKNKTSNFQWSEYVEVPAGDVEILCLATDANKSLTRVQKIEFIALAHQRTAGYNVGDLGTVCLEDATFIEGANLYELAGLNEYGYLAFDEILSGELEAGKPYLFEVTNPSQISFYKPVGAAHSDNEIETNGMIGTFNGTTLYQNAAQNYYYFSGRHIWRVNDFTVSIPIPANRCYVDMDVLRSTPAPQQAAPGRRRVTMGVNGKQTPTGIDAINASEKPMKIMIDGQIYILRGEKMYDVTGKLVK